MKSYILLCLFFIAAINSADHLAVFSQKTASISKLSDAELDALWQQLQTALTSSKDRNFQEKAKIFVDKMVKEKLKRVMNDKQAQDVFSAMLLEVLLAVAFEGSALMLSGESAAYAIYASVTHQLAYSLGNLLTRDNRSVRNVAASAVSSQLISTLLQLPTAGGGILNPDLSSVLSYGAIPADVALEKLGYKQTVISKFTQVRQSAAQFLKSLF